MAWHFFPTTPVTAIWNSGGCKGYMVPASQKSTFHVLQCMTWKGFAKTGLCWWLARKTKENFRLCSKTDFELWFEVCPWTNFVLCHRAEIGNHTRKSGRGHAMPVNCKFKFTTWFSTLVTLQKFSWSFWSWLMMLLFLCTVSSLRETKKLGRWQAVSVHHLPTLKIERVEVDNKMGPQCCSLETRGKKWDAIPWGYSCFLLLCVLFLGILLNSSYGLFLYYISMARILRQTRWPSVGKRWCGDLGMLNDIRFYPLNVVHLCDTASHDFPLPTLIVLRDFEEIVLFTVKQWSWSYHQHDWISLGW